MNFRLHEELTMGEMRETQRVARRIKRLDVRHEQGRTGKVYAAIVGTAPPT